MGKKRQSKSGTKRKRSKGYGGAREDRDDLDEIRSSGALGSMVGGFRRAVGVDSGHRKKTLLDYTWTLVLVLAVVGILAWRFL